MSPMQSLAVPSKVPLVASTLQESCKMLPASSEQRTSLILVAAADKLVLAKFSWIAVELVL